jgi:hypothetical protein
MFFKCQHFYFAHLDFFWDSSVELRALCLLDRCSSPWTIPPALLALGIFLDMSHIFARAGRDHYPLTCMASHIVGITGMRYHTSLVGRNGVLRILSGLILCVDPPKWLGLQVWIAMPKLFVFFIHLHHLQIINYSLEILSITYKIMCFIENL